MNTVSYFEIQSSDPQREVRFYSDVFGWKFIREELVPIEYYRIETNGMHGGLLRRPAQVIPDKYGTNAFACSVLVENYDHTAKQILEKGGKVILPKFPVPNRCWQGYFADPDNNVFGIFEVDENAQ